METSTVLKAAGTSMNRFVSDRQGCILLCPVTPQRGKQANASCSTQESEVEMSAFENKTNKQTFREEKRCQRRK